MAQVANTFVSTSAVGNREELSDVVNRITPEDTPIYSMIRKGTCKTTHPEWEYDELAAPGANAQLEGDEYNFSAVTTPTRVGNYTQILRKSFIVSNTQEASDNAGQNEKVKEQKLKKGIEIRKDVEYAIVDNNASVSGQTRELGGLPSWIETNVSRGTGTTAGANGGFNQGTGLTVAATDATNQRAFTKALLDDTLQSAYQQGANVTHASMSPYAKRVFTTFMSDSNVASFRYAATGSSNSIIATADIYEGDFGKVMMVPNRIQASSAALARNIFLIDPDMLEFCWLRKIAEDKDVAKTGDAQKRVLIGEGTLKVKNEKGLGVIADIYGLTAST